MPVEALSSNVVNYLVWRYLQEAGYKNAAEKLQKDWNREPDGLPFARNVAQHALVHLLQDGLWFDKLQAEASDGPRRYHFGDDHGRPFSERNGDSLTLDQGIPAHELCEDLNGQPQEQPPPKKGPKKKKVARPNGVEPPPSAHSHSHGHSHSHSNSHVNGDRDAMDVDHNGHVHTHVTNSVRAESEPMVSEPESPTVAEIPISTLSIGLSLPTQTEQPEQPEQPVDLAPNTVFACSVKEPGKIVTQTLWGSPDAPLLVTAGKSLLRLHHMPPSTGATTPSPPEILNLNLPPENYNITALCWNSHGEITVSAQEERANERGETMKIDKLFKVVEGGTQCRVVSSAAGMVTTLRWNASKQLLLAISSDGQKGSVKIWRDFDNDDEDMQLPAWTTFTDAAIFDAVWLSDSSYVICGVGIFDIYDIGDNVSPRRSLDTRIQWEMVKHDPVSGIIAAMGTQGQRAFLGILHPSNPTELQVEEYPDQYLNDLHFQPRHSSNPPGISNSSIPYPSPVLLATCATSGVARVWDANQPFKCLKRLPTVEDIPISNIAFSPDGTLLAAAGPDAVTVWKLEKRDLPVAVWRARDVDHGEWDSSIDGEFSLGWDPNSSRLSIALGNQIALIPV